MLFNLGRITCQSLARARARPHFDTDTGRACVAASSSQKAILSSQQAVL